MGRLHIGVALRLRDPDLAKEVARQELGSVRSERLHPTLLERVRLGDAVGLTVVEMERMAGCSRQTIYNAREQLKKREGLGGDDLRRSRVRS
jgi:hypothetical protein